MKTMDCNSYSSVKTVDDLKKVVTLSTEQSEALKLFFASYNYAGDLEVAIGDICLHLSLRGRAKNTLYVDEELVSGKAQALSDAFWQKEVLSRLQNYWKDRECCMSYGALRHQMSQAARGYSSRADKCNDMEARMACHIVARRLQDKNEVRQMLNFLSKLKSIPVNTFEFMRGQGGRIRIALFVRKQS